MDRMNQKLAVISPCRDKARFVELAFKSLVAQTRKPDPWINVADGSRDNTCELPVHDLRGAQLYRLTHFNRLAIGAHSRDAL